MDKWIEKLRSALAAPLPGREAHKKMINIPGRKLSDPEKQDPGARRGAVLVLVYPKNGEDHVVLILRNTYDGIHSGQVGLPGGKEEAEDRDLVATALRESHEEVGINPSEVDVLGRLSPIYIPPSRFLVYPFVGHIGHTPAFQRDPYEVAKIIEAPLEVLLDHRYRKFKTMHLASQKAEFPVKYFDVSGHVVWGATAMILSEFSEVVMACKA